MEILGVPKSPTSQYSAVASRGSGGMEALEESSFGFGQGRKGKRTWKKTSSRSTPTSMSPNGPAVKKIRIGSKFDKGMHLLYMAAQWVELNSTILPRVFVAEKRGENENPSLEPFSPTIIELTPTAFHFKDGHHSIVLEDGTIIDLGQPIATSYPNEFCTPAAVEEQIHKSDAVSSYSVVTEDISPAGSPTSDEQEQVADNNLPGHPGPKATTTRSSVIQYATLCPGDPYEREQSGNQNIF